MSERETSPRQSRAWLSWAVMILLLAIALVLRWRYIQEISLFVDEFVTAWAARNVLTQGLPLFPSGNIYPHGFLFTYLVVPFVSGEFNETLARVPALIVGLAALPAVYWVGRRLFSDQVGLIAAAIVAVDPDCIVWGSRVRMYGLLQLLTLLVVYFHYRGIAGERARDRYVAMALLVAAVFTHGEAAFLLPILGLATLVVVPWRRILRWSVILPFALGAAGTFAFYLIDRFGQPGHLETLQETRPYLALSGDILGGPQAFGPVFLEPHRLPLTILAILGLVFVIRPRIDRRSPLTYLYVILSGFVALLVLLAGTTWQRDRYLFLVLPLLFLIGAEVITRLLALIPPLPGRRHPHPGLSAILAILVALWVGLTGTRTAYVQEWGYDQAFRYLRDQQPEESDRILTSMSTAAMLYLGRNDGFVIQQGYEEYLVPHPTSGVAADLWTATPAITTTAAFTDVLSGSPRVWFITDGWRFQTRYEPGFILTVLVQMELVYDERGILVFRGTGYTPPSEPPIQRERWADFGGELALTGFGLSSAAPASGDNLDVTLYWQAMEEAGPAYTAFLHLVSPDGNRVAGVDEPLLGGMYQPTLWGEDQIVPDRHQFPIPPDLPPGRYRLDLGLYHPGQPEQPLDVEGGSRIPLVMLEIDEVAEPSPPAVASRVDFGGQARLTGHDLQCDLRPAACDLTLHWLALNPMERDYTVFVHLVDPSGAIVAQGDGPPGDPFFPTSTWLPGQTVASAHRLEVPASAKPGTYTLLTGLYHAPTGERPQAIDADGNTLGDALPLTTIPIGSEAP